MVVMRFIPVLHSEELGQCDIQWYWLWDIGLETHSRSASIYAAVLASNVRSDTYVHCYLRRIVSGKRLVECLD